MTKQSAIETHRGLTPRAMTYRCNRVLSLVPGVSLRRYIFVLQPLANLPQPNPHYVAQVTDADAPFLGQLWPDSSLRARRFSQGARCLTVELSGRVVAGLWLADHHHLEDEVCAEYRFESVFSWDFGLYVHPESRNTRAFAALWGAVGHHLRHTGKIGTLSRISDYLGPSLGSHARMGAQAIGSAIFLAAGGWQACRVAGMVSLAGPRSCPVLTFAGLRA